MSFPMIKSAKVWRWRRKYAQLELLTFSSWETLPIYRKWFMDPSLFFLREESLLWDKISHSLSKTNPSLSKINLQKVRDLRTRKFVDKYLLRVFRLYPFIHNKLAMSGKTVGWGTWNFRLGALRLASGRTPRLSHTSLQISYLGSAYQF